jgi:hypothetical protein
MYVPPTSPHSMTDGENGLPSLRVPCAPFRSVPLGDARSAPYVIPGSLKSRVAVPRSPCPAVPLRRFTISQSRTVGDGLRATDYGRRTTDYVSPADTAIHSRIHVWNVRIADRKCPVTLLSLLRLLPSTAVRRVLQPVRCV